MTPLIFEQYMSGVLSKFRILKGVNFNRFIYTQLNNVKMRTQIFDNICLIDFFP